MYKEIHKKTIKIEASLPKPVREVLTKYLQRNHDFVAWMKREIPGLKPKIACHTFSIQDDIYYVAQYKWK